MRTLFPIHAGKAHLAEALPDSVTHMSWMIDQGVIKSQTDAADVVRGQPVAGFLILYRGFAVLRARQDGGADLPAAPDQRQARRRQDPPGPGGAIRRPGRQELGLDLAPLELRALENLVRRGSRAEARVVMSRKAASFTQADVARALRAAQQAGPDWNIEIEGGVIRFVRSAPPSEVLDPIPAPPDASTEPKWVF